MTESVLFVAVVGSDDITLPFLRRVCHGNYDPTASFSGSERFRAALVDPSGGSGTLRVRFAPVAEGDVGALAGASAAVLCFDSSRAESFAGVTAAYEHAASAGALPRAQLLLGLRVGGAARAFDAVAPLEWADARRIFFTEASAADGWNVPLALSALRMRLLAGAGSVAPAAPAAAAPAPAPALSSVLSPRAAAARVAAGSGVTLAAFLSSPPTLRFGGSSSRAAEGYADSAGSAVGGDEGGGDGDGDGDEDGGALAAISAILRRDARTGAAPSNTMPLDALAHVASAPVRRELPRAAAVPASASSSAPPPRDTIPLTSPARGDVAFIMDINFAGSAIGPLPVHRADRDAGSAARTARRFAVRYALDPSAETRLAAVVQKRAAAFCDAESAAFERARLDAARAAAAAAASREPTAPKPFALSVSNTRSAVADPDRPLVGHVVVGGAPVVGPHGGRVLPVRAGDDARALVSAFVRTHELPDASHAAQLKAAIRVAAASPPHVAPRALAASVEAAAAAAAAAASTDGARRRPLVIRFEPAPTAAPTTGNGGSSRPKNNGDAKTKMSRETARRLAKRETPTLSQVALQESDPLYAIKWGSSPHGARFAAPVPRFNAAPQPEPLPSTAAAHVRTISLDGSPTPPQPSSSPAAARGKASPLAQPHYGDAAARALNFGGGAGSGATALAQSAAGVSSNVVVALPPPPPPPPAALRKDGARTRPPMLRAGELSHPGRPLFNLDVDIGGGHKRRVVVSDGVDVRTLAEAFAHEHALAPSTVPRLVTLIAGAIATHAAREAAKGK